MDYETPGCAYCPPTVRACRQGESESRGPGFCPSKVDGEGIAEADAAYRDPLTGVWNRVHASEVLDAIAWAARAADLALRRCVNPPHPGGVLRLRP